MSGFQPPVLPSNGSHGRHCDPGTGSRSVGHSKVLECALSKRPKEVFMLKKLTVVCGLLLAATAAMAGRPWPWVELDPTPYPVGYDAHITCGADRIWGMFNSGDTETFVYDYYPLSTDTLVPPDIGEWHPNEWDEAPFSFGCAATFTGMTFDWQHNTLWVIVGDTTDQSEYGGPDGSLWQYDPGSGWWDFDIEDDTSFPEDFEFFLDSGACITYAPNPAYSAMNQVDGYIYCLPGLSRESWRFSIEPDSDIVSSGIFPPNGSTIADQTPLFRWTGGSIVYRLQVATSPLFGLGSIVMDTVVSATECQTQSKLADTLYYWRTGTPNGLDWTWASALSFTEEGGWAELDPINDKVYAGAAMAYYAGHIVWGGEPRVYALTGGTDPGTGFFNIGLDEDDNWVRLVDDPAPKPAWPGTSLTTSPTGSVGWCLVAVFGGSVQYADQQYGYEPGDQGRGWFRYPNEVVDPLPQTIGPGGTCVLGPSPWTYLVAGAKLYPYEPTYDFYAIDPKYKKPKKDKDEGGSQAGDVLAGTARARVLASHDGIEVEYQLPAAARVRATLHDAVGRQVGVLDIGMQEPGTHRLSWNQDRGGRELASGAYFVLLDMGVEKATLKAIIR